MDAAPAPPQASRPASRCHRAAVAEGLSRLLADTYTLYLTTQFGRLASVKDAPADPPKALEMVRLLVAGHETVARTARGLFAVADAANDQPTMDLLTQRLDIHEKTAWMLRALLEE